MGKRALEGNLGYKGERGYSAYEIAVLNGYEGTEQEWIDHFGLDLTGYLKTADVVDALDSTYVTRPLSANMGKELKDSVDELDTNKVNFGDFAVVTATITPPEAGSSSINGVVSVNYPTGFTKNNTYVVSVMSNLTTSQDGYWKVTFTATPQPGEEKAYTPYVKLQNDEIRVSVYKAQTSDEPYETKVKLLLMKLS